MSMKNSTQTKGSLLRIMVHSFETYEVKPFLFVQQQRIIMWLRPEILISKTDTRFREVLEMPEARYDARSMNGSEIAV